MKRARHFLMLIVHRPAEGRFVFTSRDYDVDRPMQYNRVRCFDPSVGRWLSAEPLACGSEESNLFPYPPSR